MINSTNDNSYEKKIIKIKNDPDKHYPNKNESKLLRKLKAETGLSEDEIRSHKKYRKLLSDAQKIGEKSFTNKRTKFYKNVIKEACKKTGLVPQHPETIKKIDEIMYDYNNNLFKPIFLYSEKLNGKGIVRLFANSK